MADIKQLETIIDETELVSVSLYYSTRDMIWIARVLKTKTFFSNDSFWKTLSEMIQHIKLNRKYITKKKKYRYIPHAGSNLERYMKK
jgi:hypothetical protein